MIVLIEGICGAENLGSGKTLYLIRNLVTDFNNGRKIFCNIRINGIEYQQLFIEDFLDETKTDYFKNATVGIDEITLFMDCRHSMQNTFLSYIFLQSRKRHLDFYLTTQDYTMLDGRLLPYITVHVIMELIFDSNNKPLKDYRLVTVINMKNRKNITENSFIINITPWFKHYDTDEIVKPLYRSKQIVRTNELKK
jgi:hypothetical protein